MTALLAPPSTQLRRNVGAGLMAITAASWAYLVFLSDRMGDMGSPFAMPMTSAWTVSDALLMSTMWVVMMAGMMLPSAAPMIAAYDTTIRSGTRGITGSTSLFVAGYLTVWSGFAALATGLQWLLHDLAVVDAMGVSTRGWFGGALLVAAGAYQFTGAKDLCVRQCRTPLGFLLNEWRSGPRGAATMGAHHGALCLGCCWALMAMLFVLGVMNLWWVALVAAIVLLEKTLPTDRITAALGTVLIAWGGVLILGSAL